MKLAEIVRVDSKGRITIPMVVRESLGIIEGMNLILIADTEKKEITISPLPTKTLNLYEFYIEIKDVPGALASVSRRLAELGVDQITTHCTTIKRGELAECVMVVDVSQAKQGIEDIKKSLVELPEVQLVNIRQMRK
ncbi:MAG: AbrB family transcriptional regulator [Pyrodictiaceae archaeon]